MPISARLHKRFLANGLKYLFAMLLAASVVVVLNGCAGVTGASSNNTSGSGVGSGGALAVSTSSLAGGTVGTAYSAMLSATGGTTPYSWSLSSGSLPAGLTLNASSGAISGTPTTSGSSTFTAQVTDASSNTATASLSISVAAGSQTLSISTSSLAGGTVGTAYSATLQATGGTTPYSWSVSSGSLAAGLTLNASSGAISGTPTASGTSTFTAKVTDASSKTATKSLSIAISSGTQGLSITTSGLSGGTVGASYSTTLHATGGTTPYTWTVSSGSLPTGLTLNSSSGAISGTPTAAGSFSFGVQVKDSSSPVQAATKSFTVAIAATGSSLSILTGVLPQAEDGAAYSATLTASGGTTPYTWSVTSGSLPTGLSLNSSTGQITGTPSANGAFSMTAQVKDSSSPVQTASAQLSITVNSSSSGNCPTGQACGAIAPYCDTYAPPSLAGATLISSLPYKITSSGNYYLDSDLTSTGVGIAVEASNVDINLNGHTLTYGTSPIGSGSSQAAEYGVVLCNTNNISSSNEAIDSSYGSNGYCESSWVSAENVTIENGTITESPNASSYYDPSNCPGSGINSGCAHNHDSIASHAIAAWYTYGLKVTHVTINFQTVDAYGIRMQYQQAGGSYGLDAECNTLNNSVTQYNERDEANASIWTGNDSGAANTVQYNTIIGGAQGGILLGVGGKDPQGTLIAYNDVAQAANQGGTSAHMYSNDYAISACSNAGTVEYNYVHSAEGRGIGCVYGGDMNGETVIGNYVDAGEDRVNGEYGSNGSKQGAAWVSGCEIEGGKAFEVKDSFAMTVANNTFRTHVSGCGGSAVELAELPCISMSCPSTATHPLSFAGNTEVIYNNSGSTASTAGQDMACFDLQVIEGNYSNYFPTTPIFQNDSCITDGDFAVSEAYGPGDYVSWGNPSFTIGSNPYSTGCAGSGSSFPCQNAMNFQGQAGQGVPNELGYVIGNMTLGNGAALKFNAGGNFGTGTTQRGLTVEWTYTPTVSSSLTSSPISGATVSATDAGGTTSSCQTNASGQCSLVLRQEVVSSPAGGSNLTTTSMNPIAVTISASGCTSLPLSLSLTGLTSALETLICQ